MELKLATLTRSNMRNLTTFNRTIMELKPISLHSVSVAESTFNSTIMELKQKQYLAG